MHILKKKCHTLAYYENQKSFVYMAYIKYILRTRKTAAALEKISFGHRNNQTHPNSNSTHGGCG